jgi:hypothetical protein
MASDEERAEKPAGDNIFFTQFRAQKLFRR